MADNRWPRDGGALGSAAQRVPGAPGKEAGLDATVAVGRRDLPRHRPRQPADLPGDLCTDIQHGAGYLFERLIGMVDTLLARLTDASKSVRTLDRHPAELVSPAPRSDNPTA